MIKVLFARPFLAALALLLSTAAPAQAQAQAQEAAPLPFEPGEAAIPTGSTTTYTFAPRGEGPHPTVLFLQGYPCRLAEPDDPLNLARDRLVAEFVAAGFLVHIAEKPGVITGQSSKDCRDLLYSEEVAAFGAVLDQHAGRADVDPDNLFIFGHSMGGQTAPLIAQGRPVKGIVTYGIHAKPWFEFMIDITRAQAERIGIDPVQADAETRLIVPFLYDLMVAKRDWEYLAANHQEALAVGVFRAEGEYLNGRHYRFWADLNLAGFASAWGEFDGRVLALYGEYDVASISAEGAERIAAIVNHHHPGNAQAEVIAQTGHGFARVDGAFEDYLARRFAPDWAGETEASLFNPAVAERVIAWMKAASEPTEHNQPQP